MRKQVPESIAAALKQAVERARTAAGRCCSLSTSPTLNGDWQDFGAALCAH